MGLLDRLFRPKIDKLKDRGDTAGLTEILVSDGQAEQRVAAIEALAGIGPPDLAETLVSVLSDSEPAVASAAEAVLLDLGASAPQALASTLSDPVGEKALGMLLSWGDAGADTLSEALQNQEDIGRLRALDGLLEIARTTGDDDTRELVFRSLLASLGDRAPDCRVAAAEGLAELGDPRAARALAAQLKDGAESVRDACRSTLSRIGATAVPDLTAALMERNTNSRLLAAGLLGEVWSESVDLQDREAALRTLVGLAGDRDDDVRQRVTTSLAKIPVTDVVETHLERIEDPTAFEREESAELVRDLLEHGAVEPDRRERLLQRLDRLMPGLD
jgi:HEAT repeat protein